MSGNRNIDGAITKKLRELWKLAEDTLKNFTPSSLQKIVERGGKWKERIREVALEFGGEELPFEEAPEKPFDVKAYYRQTLIWRWGLFSTLLVALFCGIWYLTTGSVPVVEKIIWFKWGESLPNPYLTLPFPLSRWLDVLFAPIWAVWMSIVFLRIAEDSETVDDDDIGPLCSLLACSLLIGLLIGLSSSLVIILIVSLVTGLVAGVLAGPNVGIGLVWGLGIILGFGLIVSLGVSLVIGLVFSLVYGTLFLFRSSS